MIGHLQVVEARRRRQRPTLVDLVIGPAPAVRYGWQAPETMLAQDAVPTVYTAGEPPELADLRWLTGLRVSMLPRECSADLWGRWWAAVQAACPRFMAGIEPDTEEVVTWPA